MTDVNARPRTSFVDELRRAATNVAVPQHEPPAVVRRRRLVAAGVVVLGAVILGCVLRRQPGESAFYWLMFALAAVWFIGAAVSGPLHLGSICWRGRNQRPVITGTAVGLLLAGVFVVGALVVREIPALHDLVTRLLQFTEQGPALLLVAILVLNTIAEELFFRGSVYTAVGRHHPVIVSTAVYVGVVMAGANVVLGFAALVLGTVCALERRATGGVLAPALTHLVWGLVVVFTMPYVFGG
ncbi:lysostaphin resistance A-like protein [Mycobacterium sp.]|uniref:lysostaphin resistance A-like protein n=1 Tax=Mycobacterium sp. TaxID=1785 RepID=UPI0031DA112E